MKKLIARRFVTIPLIYLLIIVGIFVLQFTTGTVFSYNFGDFKVSGSYDKQSDGSETLAFPLHLVYKGIDICIDEKTPVLMQSSRTAEPVFPIRVIAEDNGVCLVFPGNLPVTFRLERATEQSVDASDGNPDERLVIKAEFPSRSKNSLVFPYKMPYRAFVLSEDNIQRISCDELQFAFVGKADYTAQTVTISAVSPSVSYARYIPFEGVDLAKIASSELASTLSYRQNREAFAVAAAAELKTSLTGLYTESGVTAYIAEMARSGNYRNALTAVPVAFVQGTGRTYLSNTFLDTLVKTHATLISKNKTIINKVRQQLTERNPAVFETEHLVTFMQNHLNQSAFSILTEMLSNTDFSTVTPAQAAGVLDIAAQCRRYIPTLNEVSSDAATIACDTLFAALVKTRDGLYLSYDGKMISVMETIKVSRILVDYGSVTGNAEWAAAGRALFNSLVPFMGEHANFPVRFSFITASDGETRSGVMPEAGTSAPADLLYPYIVESPYYPRELCLSSYRPGVWAWTSASSVAVRNVSDTVTEIDVSFLNDETHYMVICGIKPFTRIQLYDMDFRTDARFESYNSSGYVYNADTQILYLKMRHKQPVETVRLFYEPIAPAPAPSVEKAPSTQAEDVAVVTDQSAESPVPADEE